MTPRTSSNRSVAPVFTIELVVVAGNPLGKRVPITSPRFAIGRDPSCQLRPHSESVSPRHAELAIQEGRLLLRDLASQTGTFVNDQPVTSTVLLKNLDRIRIGPLTFEVAVRALPARRPAAQPQPRRRSIDETIASWLIDEVLDDASLDGHNWRSPN